MSHPNNISSSDINISNRKRANPQETSMTMSTTNNIDNSVDNNNNNNGNEFNNSCCSVNSNDDNSSDKDNNHSSSTTTNKGSLVVLPIVPGRIHYKNNVTNDTIIILQKLIPNASSLIPRAILLFLVIVLFIDIYDENKQLHSVLGTLLRHQQHYPIDLQYCIDPDDPVEWKKKFFMKTSTVETTTTKICPCIDPTIPKAPNKKNHKREKTWYQLHHKEVNDIKYARTLNNKTYDFIMIGDSITENWNGSTSQRNKKYRPIFEKYFVKNNNSTSSSSSLSSKSVQGLALGIGGDLTNGLLWRLQNGIISNDLKKRVYPKGFIVLIGTNNIGTRSCSKRTTLQGIVEVINYINATYGPSMPIIVHALLPRNDNSKAPRIRKDYYQLGKYYSMIEWINNELEQLCTQQPNWHYLNINSIFLQPSELTSNNNKNKNRPSYPYEIIPELMPDALHPSPKGCDVWGPLVVDAVNKYFIQQQ